MPTLYVMIGGPGSGKSIYANNISNTTVISSDEIRLELTGSYSNQLHNMYVFETLENRVEELLKKGINVVYDATNLTIASRRKITERFDSIASEIIFVYMKTPIQIALKRNEEREKRVPERVVLGMYAILEEPDIEYEYCDKIIIVKPNGKEQIIE